MSTPGVTAPTDLDMLRLSFAQRQALEAARTWGRLVRHEGGLWSRPLVGDEKPPPAGDVPYVGTKTVISLVSRGLLRWHTNPTRNGVVYPAPLTDGAEEAP